MNLVEDELEGIGYGIIVGFILVIIGIFLILKGVI